MASRRISEKTASLGVNGPTMDADCCDASSTPDVIHRFAAALRRPLFE